MGAYFADNAETRNRRPLSIVEDTIWAVIVSTADRAGQDKQTKLKLSAHGQIRSGFSR
jgi:hypothetical protein